MNKQFEKMRKDLIEIFDEEYEKERIITPSNTALKLFRKGYRKQSEGEWISVEERLPERQGYYLGCTYKGLMMIAPFFPVYADDKPEFRYDITHWMPLPNPPKMKGGE